MFYLAIGLDTDAVELIKKALPELEAQIMPFDLDKLTETPEQTPTLVVCGAPPAGVSMTEVAQLLRMQYQKQPAYLVMQAGARIDRRELLKNGMTDVFFLPLDQAVFIRALKEDVALAGANGRIFRPVKLVDLQPNTVLEFDTFIYLPANNKHIRYSGKGEEIENDRIDRLKKHNMNSLFVNPADMAKVYDYAAQALRSVGSNKTIGETERKERLHEATRELVSGLFSDNATGSDGCKRVLSDCRQIIDSYVSGGSNGKIFEKVSAVAGGEPDTYSHAVNVSTYAALFAIGLGLSNADDLAMAGLLHDIGLSKVPLEIQKKSLEQMSDLEKHTYMRHPEVAIELIRERKLVVSEKVHQIILQHHEKFNGTGFPKGLRGTRICPEAQILAFADRFDELTTVTPGMTHITPAQAARLMAEEAASNPGKAFMEPELLRQILALFPAETDAYAA